jgi:hypothetical protein
MFSYGKLAGWLLALMCVSRFLIAAASYFFPYETLALYGLASPGETPLIFFIQVWGIRDMVIAGLFLFVSRDFILPLLSGCLVIECSDAIVATLAYSAGTFDTGDLLNQYATVGVAFVPEFIAFLLILRIRTREANEQSK